MCRSSGRHSSIRLKFKLRNRQDRNLRNFFSSSPSFAPVKLIEVSPLLVAPFDNADSFAFRHFATRRFRAFFVSCHLPFVSIVNDIDTLLPPYYSQRYATSPAFLVDSHKSHSDIRNARYYHSICCHPCTCLFEGLSRHCPR